MKKWKKRKIVESLKSELTALELRNGKIQVSLPKAPKKQKGKEAPEGKEKAKKAPESKEKAVKIEATKEANKETKKQEKKGGNKGNPPVVDEKPVDVSRLNMKVGKIIECTKHPGNYSSFN